MKYRLILTLVAILVPLAASARSIDQALMKLEPEERAHQACIIKGLSIVQKEKRLRGADRMKTSIFGRAAFDGTTHLMAKGGAVRVKKHWYRLSFECKLTPDQMKATSFSYQLGAEIPHEDWEDLGLWQ